MFGLGGYSREMLTSLGVVAEDAQGRFRFRHDGMDGHDCFTRRMPGVVGRFLSAFALEGKPPVAPGVLYYVRG